MKKPSDRPDMVITDIDMPHVDGRQLISLMSRDPLSMHIPVIVVSSSADDDLRNAPGVIATFVKPVPMADIRLHLETLIAQRRQREC